MAVSMAFQGTFVEHADLKSPCVSILPIPSSTGTSNHLHAMAFLPTVTSSIPSILPGYPAENKYYEIRICIAQAVFLRFRKHVGRDLVSQEASFFQRNLMVMIHRSLRSYRAFPIEKRWPISEAGRYAGLGHIYVI